MLKLDSTFGDLLAELKANGGKAVVREVGTFTVKETPERQGRNPGTGEPIMIAAGKRLAFKPSPALKRKL